MRTLGLAMFLTGMAVGVIGCGGAPSCKEALGHLYDVGCAIAFSGVPQSRADAISYCEGSQKYCASCNGPLDDELNCLANVSPAGCSSKADVCASQFQAYNACKCSSSTDGGPDRLAAGPDQSRVDLPHWYAQ